MIKNIFELGSVLINILIRSKVDGDVKDNFVDIVSALKALSLNEFEARNINRGFQKIADEIAFSCEGVLDNIKIDEERKSIIVENLRKAYNNAQLSIVDLLKDSINEDALTKKILNSNAQYTDDLNEKEKEYYKRLITHISHLLANAYIYLPEFNAEGIKRLNYKMDEIDYRISKLIEQVNTINESLHDNDGAQKSNFERIYRNKIITQNSYVSLFGAGNLESEYKRYELSIAYVELEIFDIQHEKEININEMLKNAKNIWLSGDAGLGKTTFLQWIAVKTAENTKEIRGLRNKIPVLIRLREYDCRKMSLVSCIKNVMKDSSYPIPEGWIDELISKGTFLFLIDGFDEISVDERNAVLRWLEEIDGKNQCIKIYTARPQVKERPNCKALIEANILPMNRIRIKRFVDYWHKAVLEEQLKVDINDSKKTANELYEKIIMSDPIMRLASVPLLCAMICALHYRNERILPTNKRELYEECCKMLIDRRDKERGVIEKKLDLTYEQKKIILAKLAYWMLKNNYVQVSEYDVKKNIKLTIEGMTFEKGADDEERIFIALLERCGILREPEKGKIDFIHRTFQEYLAAFEICREDDWGVVKEKIGNTVWQETIGLSVGFAQKEIASQIIQITMDKSIKSGEKNKYLFLAIFYLREAVEVHPELRKEIEQRVGEMIPPSIEECAQIAEAGDLAVQFLNNKNEYNKQDRINCLRVLKMAGTIKAIEVSKSYFDRVLCNEELQEIGELYSQFTKKELEDNEIPDIIKNYINFYPHRYIALHYEMINILGFLYIENKRNQIEKDINALEIIDYVDDIPDIPLFSNIKILNVVGCFDSIEDIKYFCQIEELRLYSKSDKFSIYDLNAYNNLYKINSFSIISTHAEYITGQDLNFLAECRELEIILLNNCSEISFEEFDSLKNLRKLTVGADFAADLDFFALPDYIEELTILAPQEYMPYISDQIRFFPHNYKVRILELPYF